MILSILIVGIFFLLVIPEQKQEEFEDSRNIQAIERADQISRQAPWSK
jgi:preprotein translocase subunit YajC